MNGRPWVDPPRNRKVNHAPHCNICGDPVNDGHRMNKVGLVCPRCDRDHRRTHFAEAAHVEPRLMHATLGKVNR